MAAVLAVGAFVATIAIAADNTLLPGSAEAGRKLYVATGCGACHGLAAQGSTSSGPRLAPAPLEFEAFLAQMRKPRNEMPPYEAAILSDQQIVDIYAYLRGVAKGRDAKDIPLLNN